MASAGAKINKLILDIQDCVQQLKNEFISIGVPIDDDNTRLHNLCDRLEHLLQTELKEKYGLLGTRKTYWDYFCKCLASRRGIHDGLKFVKSVSEFKTAAGRGRAFIRYLLVHQCLADTLQQCFLDGRITSDFYNPDSVLLQYEQTSYLISVLYDLNEIQFDISSHGHDLDVSWPTFARKVFGAPSLWKAPSRTVSLTSLISIQSDVNHASSHDNVSCGNLYGSHLPHIESSVVDLLSKVDEIQHEQAEAKDLTRKMHETVTQSESWWRSQEEDLKNKITEVEQMAGEYAHKFETAENQQETVLVESELELKVRNLEQPKSELEMQIESLKDQLLLKEQAELQLLASQDQLKLELERRDVAASSCSDPGIVSNDFSTQVVEIDLGIESSASEPSTKDSLLSNKALIEVEIKTLRDENERFKEQTEKWKKCIAGFAEKVAIKERVNGHLEKQVEALKEAVSTMKEMMHVKMVETNSLKNLVQELKALQSLRSDAEDSDEKIKSLENENMDLKEKVTNCNANFENLRQDLDSKLKLLSEKEQSLVLMEAKAQTIGLTLSQTEVRASQLTERLNAITLENQTLNRRLDTMREMLKKVETAEEELEKLEAEEVDTNNSNQNDNDDGSGPSSDSHQFTINFVLCDEQCMLPEDLPVIAVVKRTVGRLQSLISEKQELQHQLESSNEINSNLISKVQEQEEKLSTVTFELCETKALVERLKVSHNKLQTSEAILRYELKEKRSVVERMKQMLESSRAQWMRIRQKHNESEIEWQSLRADFASRLKQESVESGFVEDSSAGRLDEGEGSLDSEKQANSPTSDMAALSSDGTDADAPALQASSPPTTSELEDLPEVQTDDDEDVASGSADRSQTRTRLRIMEEQCRLLYSKLVASVKKSEFLEWKLSQLHSRHGGTEDEDSSSKDGSESAAKDTNAPYDIMYVPYLKNAKKSGNDTPESQESIQDCEQQQDVTNSEEETSESFSCHTENSATDDAAPEQTESEPLSPDITDENKVQPLAMAQALPKRIELLRRRKEDLELNMRRMTEEKSESDAREADLRSQLEVMKSLLLARDSQMDSLATEKADLLQREAEFKKRADFIMRKEREEKEARYQAVMKAKQEVQIKLGSLQNQIESRQEQIVKLETVLTKTSEELETTKATLEQEVASLQFQLSSEALKHERAMKSYAEHEAHIAQMQERISEQERHISYLEDELEGIKQDRDEEKERQRIEFQEVQMRLSAREEECAALNDDLKETTRQYDTEKNKNSQLTAFFEATNAENSKLKEELNELNSDFMELKKRMVKLIREKDLLWKRSEHLSFIQKIQATDRWLKDDEVTHCLGCKAEFTFILRKHHCRRCGKVYCRSCCDHWVMTTASSRRVRVCNECILNHSHIEPQSVIIDSDDENDESISSANSESLQSPQTPNEQGEFSGMPSLDKPEGAAIVGSLPVNIPSVGTDSLDENRLVGCSSEGQSPSTSSSVNTDERSTREGGSLLGRLFASWSLSPRSKAIPDEDDEEFYVISDEEIMKSLSHSSPYAPLGAESCDPCSYVCPTRPIEEILAEFGNDLPREVWVNAGKSYAVPVLVDNKTTITWEFTTEPKSIAFSLIFHALTPNEQSELEDGTSRRLTPPNQILIPITHCDSHLHPVHGKLVAKKPGIYTFYFDNGFSRFMAKKVKFILRVPEKSEQLEQSQDQNDQPPSCDSVGQNETG